MTNPEVFSNPKERLVFPFLRDFYQRIAQPLAWTVFRLAIGLTLTIEGWPKITNPFAQIGFVENMGFYPGWLWSPLLAVLQVFGGFLIAIGLFTRPAALACGVMLAITLWFHLTHPYGNRFLTPEAIAAIANGGGEYLTADGLRRLADGGATFLHSVQIKAEQTSLFWTGGAFIFAAFGGGYWSVDRIFLKKVF